MSNFESRARRGTEVGAFRRVILKLQLNLIAITTSKQSIHHSLQPQTHISNNGIRMESCRYYVSSPALAARCSIGAAIELSVITSGKTDRMCPCSYNRYLAIASRVVRRSLKDDKRLLAEKRGEQELRFAKWTVCLTT